MFVHLKLKPFLIVRNVLIRRPSYMYKRRNIMRTVYCQCGRWKQVFM